MKSVLEQLQLQVQTLEEKQETQERCISISADNSRKTLCDHAQLKQQVRQMQQQMQVMQQQMHHLQMVQVMQDLQLQEMRRQADFLGQMQQDFVGQMQFFKDLLTSMSAVGQQLRWQAEVAAKAAGPVATSSSGTQIVCKTSKTKRAGNISRSSSSSDETAGQQNVDAKEASIFRPTHPTGQRAQTLELARHVVHRSPGVEESAPVLSDAGAPPPLPAEDFLVESLGESCTPSAPLVKADEAEWEKRCQHLSVRLSELESRFETLLPVSIVADDVGRWQ